MAARRDLRELERIYATFGGAAGAKLALLRALAKARLPVAKDVLRLHEILCFLRAYPDDAAVLAQVEQMLERFDRRADLRAHRRALADSGIAGTTLHFRFFGAQARRLVARWSNMVSIDWPEIDEPHRFDRYLPHLMVHAERPACDDHSVTARNWLKRFGPSDAAILVRGLSALGRDDSARDAIYDDLDPALAFTLGPGAPARTREKVAAPVVFQTRPLERARPDLKKEMRRAPLSVERVPPDRADAFIDLARDAMLPRQRDLEVFSYGSRDDVRLVDAGGGLSFACIGVIPERRSLLEAVYGLLMLKNGVAVGYALCSALFASSEIAYNVFETFRGGETAPIFGRLVATIHALFGSDSFAIDPYQLGGDGNKEGLESGAFWFYQKLGFAPHAPDTMEILRRELSQIGRRRGYRSPIATLKQLSRGYVFFHASRARNDVLGKLSPPAIAMRVSRLVSDRWGDERERARTACKREAATLLGVRSTASWTRAELQAWERWAPLVVALPGIERWSRSDKRALVDIVRAKGGRCEGDFVALFDRHRALRAAVVQLASGPLLRAQGARGGR